MFGCVRVIALLFALLASAASAQVIPSGPWGSINYWGVSGASQVLNPGTAGQCLQTQGVGSAPIWVPCSVASLSLLPPINTNQFYCNTSGQFAPPVGCDVNAILNTVGYDIARPPAVESILYKSNVGPTFNWQTLPPGLQGNILTSGGPTNPPFWSPSPTQSNLASICTTIGAVLYFDTPSLLWKCLSPGTSGQVLQTGGASGNPTWLTLSATAPLSYTNGNLTTTTGTLTSSNDTNVTIALGGTPTNALFNPVSLTMGWTGTLGVARGGTGSGTQQGALNNIMCSPTRAGDVAYWNGSNWVCLAGNNSGTQVLTENPSGVPSWAPGAGTVTSVTCNGLAISGSGTCPEPYGSENCSLAASVASNLLTVALKDNSGNDPSATSPCRIAFRSSTAATGSLVLDSVTGALSINTNATGATLGSSSNAAFRFWVVAFDNGGTVVLSLYNASSSSACLSINEGAVQSSTAISGSATSAGVYYTPNGTTLSSKAVRILGYVEYNSTGLATAGTYASAPNFIQVFGSGVKKPCDIIQGPIQFTVTNNPSTTTATAFSATTLSGSITPTSAADSIGISASGSLECSATATFAGKLALMRSGTAVSPPVFVYCPTNGSIIISASSVQYADRPNTTSSTTYAAGIASSVSTQTTFFPAAGPDNTGGGVLWLWEVQG